MLPKPSRTGLVNHVVPDAEIESYVRELAETIAGNAPLTIRAVKRIVRELRRDPDEPDVAACDALVKQCFESADYQRRPPGVPRKAQTCLSWSLNESHLHRTNRRAGGAASSATAPSPNRKKTKCW